MGIQITLAIRERMRQWIADTIMHSLMLEYALYQLREELGLVEQREQCPHDISGDGNKLESLLMIYLFSFSYLDQADKEARQLVELAIWRHRKYQHHHAGAPDGAGGCYFPMELCVELLVDKLLSLIENRPYRAGFSLEEARAIILTETAPALQSLANQVVECFKSNQAIIRSLESGISRADNPGIPVKIYNQILFRFYEALAMVAAATTVEIPLSILERGQWT